MDGFAGLFSEIGATVDIAREVTFVKRLELGVMTLGHFSSTSTKQFSRLRPG